MSIQEGSNTRWYNDKRCLNPVNGYEVITDTANKVGEFHNPHK